MGRSGSAVAAYGAAVLLALCVTMPVSAAPATKKPEAKSAVAHVAPAPLKKSVAYQSSKSSPLKTSKVVYAARSYGISCVPYARSVTGMDIKGNAKDWWGNAAGQYARGNQPESGSVMSFRDTSGMRLGHVAVVTRVVDSRMVEIDHANWRGPGATKGNVFKSIPVMDVSDNNDWSRVRVGLGHTGDYGGTVYPTNGFIYDRPDSGQMVAQASVRQVQASAALTPSTWRDSELIHREVR
jgi:surface antigen